jgi:methionyl-tRNA synthetase
VDNLKTMLTPFLPFSSQRLHRMLGYEDVIAPQPQVREFAEDGDSHLVLTGDYESVDRWRPSKLAAGIVLPPPEALFKRLDEVVEEEPPASS